MPFLKFLTDRFTEFDLLTVVPLLLRVSIAGYLVLQAFALIRMRGWWQRLACLSLLPILYAAFQSTWAWAHDSPLWPVPLLVMGPVASLYLAALCLAYSWRRRVVQMSVLAAVATGLVLVVSQQGLGWNLGGSPGAIEAEYKTEDAWIVTELARDVAEISSYSGDPSAVPPVVQVQALRPGVYTVESDETARAPVELDLRQGLWDPAQFQKLAAAFLGARARVEPPGREGTFQSVHELLLDLGALTLVDVSGSESQALARDVRNRAAHEAAALTIGAFALREASGHFQDPRWALGRMTAHLAIARALSPASESGMDGALAQATLLTLSNEEVRALDLLKRIEAGTDTAAIRAWTTSLRVRLTQDWRLLRDPRAASILEKSEYLRARREGASGTRAAPDLTALGIDAGSSAHWLRIIQNGYRGVEEGHLFADAALPLERGEASAVLTRLGGSPRDLTDQDLNARAGRCMTQAGPVVLPWGAWAEFSQRHLAMLVGNVNRFYVLGLSSTGGALTSDLELEAELGNLAMFPVATTMRLRGPKGSDADLRRINDAIALASRSPERVNSEMWSWLEGAAGYEAVKQGMPPSAAWFAGPVVPYDAGFRATLRGRSISAEELDTLRLRAPSDYGLATAYLRARYAEAIPFAEIQRVLGSRLQYDLRSINYARKYVRNDEDQMVLLREACRMSAIQCGQLAGILARLGREDEAAAEYEKAFADPSVSRLFMANEAGWLVYYYHRHQRVDDAMALAREAAAVGSYGGLSTLAYLDEHLGRLSEAEPLFRQAAERYDNPAQLIGFYLRRTRDFKESAWEASLKEWLPRVFPDGLQPAPASMATKPERGVIVVADNERARKAGLQAGDIIVGLEGYRVDNVKQYSAINASFETNEMKLTAWRGNIFQVAAAAPNRLFGVEIRSYPIQGWGE